MVEPGLPKPVMGVRFPSPALLVYMRLKYIIIIFSLFMVSCTSVPTKRVSTKNIFTPSSPTTHFIKSTLKFVWPVKGVIVGTFNQIKNNDFNRGIDIKTNYRALVRASERGKVAFVGALRGFGKTIIISHPKGLITVYTNNCEVFVKEEKEVEKGEIIGRVGLDPWTGEPILHFEVRKNTVPVNPLVYLK